MASLASRAVLCAAFLSAFVSSAAPPAQRFLDNSPPSGWTWQKYVRSPATTNVAPVRILPRLTSGNVSNPAGVITGRSPTILSRLDIDDEVPSIVLDFGQVVAGQLQISFGDGSFTRGKGLPGIVLAFSETLQFLSRRSDFTRSDNGVGNQRLTNGTDQVAVKPRPYVWTDQLRCEYEGSQVCADGLHGFRFVKIRLDSLAEDAPYTRPFGVVVIESITLKYSGFLGTPDTFTGHFECSDPSITQWFYDAVYTADLCSDVFLANNTEPRNAASPSLLGKRVLHDGPKRDRDPYVGDLAVLALTSYLTHSDHAAARNVLEDLAVHQREDGWIPPASINDYSLPLFDYPLWWVVCSKDHVWYTGNLSYAEAFYPAVVKALDGFYVSHTNTKTGLIERAKGYGDYAFLPRNGTLTYDNALHALALSSAADLAMVVGRYDDAARWRSRARTIGPALIRRNFDRSVGAFFDGGPCHGALICPTHAQDGNSLSILAGLVPDDPGSPLWNSRSLIDSILSYLSQANSREYGNSFYDNSLLDPGSDFGNRVYPFISYFEIAARFSAGPVAASSAFEELRRLYGWMASHEPGTTFWEGIGANGTPYEGGFTSMAHGWSTGVVPLMMNFVLGVTPTKPGFAEWRVRPVTRGGGLTWAAGVVPAADNGEIEVRWERRGDQFRIRVSGPEWSKGEVAIPVSGPLDSVSLDGALVYDGTKKTAVRDRVQYSDGYVTVAVSGGTHELLGWLDGSAPG